MILPSLHWPLISKGFHRLLNLLGFIVVYSKYKFGLNSEISRLGKPRKRNLPQRKKSASPGNRAGRSAGNALTHCLPVAQKLPNKLRKGHRALLLS